MSLTIQSVFSPAFARYGQILEGYDLQSLLEALKATEKPMNGTVYVPSDPLLERTGVFSALQDGFYGGMSLQMGYCNGFNAKLDCLEYHRNSEVNIPADDVVLLLAPLQALENGVLSTAGVEAFLVPAGAAVELYATTLHYAPCDGRPDAGFRVAIALPKGTNTQKRDFAAKTAEDRRLWAQNKWLLAHPDSPEAGQGAYVGLCGDNITVSGLRRNTIC